VRSTDDVQVSVQVRNTGTIAADEVVQLYQHRVSASVARPLQELAGFRRITLAPGETRTVAFTLTPAQLSFLDASMHPVNEPGKVELQIGASSSDIRVRLEVDIEE
jgi:beta-glucosidase